MSEDSYSVEEAAGRLKLHAKTVLRFIREGRLRATKVGKAYRIQRGEVDRLLGAPVRESAGARATCIVDVPDLSPERAERLSTLLSAARTGAEAHPEPMALSVAHDPVRRAAKVVIHGAPADAAALLRILDAWLEG